MKKYKVHLSDEIYYTIEVTAKDKDEAIDKAEEIWNEGEEIGECINHTIHYASEIK